MINHTQQQLESERLGSDKAPKDAPQSGLALQERVQTKKPAMFKVLLHNDDFTPMEFVTHILNSVFHRKQSECTRIMLHVHRTGIGVAGVYTREIAETKVRKVLDLARRAESPLQCTTEEA
jgi:ATP-dependent Clp protease adaptor protein ClpS